MVARITVPDSLNRALNYNERKVEKGRAECLYAGNFLHYPGELTLDAKRSRLQRLMEISLLKSTTRQITLNFHPSDHLPKEKLIAIAVSYMKGIGFGDQPYLVYQHFDAGHPHLHLVTTHIRQNNRCVETPFFLLEKVRKEIENDYALVKAAHWKQQEDFRADEWGPRKMIYGSSETKRTITIILGAVTSQYKFTSLEELNAILNLFNVTASRGKEGSRLYHYRGLLYHTLNESGSTIGVPIKASSLYFKPTLARLEEKFSHNKALLLPFRSRVKTAIDWTLLKKPSNLEEFVSLLQKEKITTVLGKDGQDSSYEMRFIDHRHKNVFTGSDLGAGYSTAGILERISQYGGEHKERLTNFLQITKGNTDPIQKTVDGPNQANDSTTEISNRQDLPLKNGDLWALLKARKKNIHPDAREKEQKESLQPKLRM